ncbi:PorP/SprF family type IX secretion system membrane protein [Arundinibacter roseus]|uniref:Type IX secretion system membrane protein PorP/SprF n=1 Tax=Arundinibacter roseus TaxID=2070510 RepID=A0A4R4KF80_9BACT|nr:PorP/SprF family type IX secretion system membrane protein [Arundinibacter roseus]TDB65251.1 type IX secretion system membrane protein PorP/SprF [Arundinibacter roseus]
MKSTKKYFSVIRSLFIVALLSGISSISLAQKEVLYEQYLQNPMAINPAFTGIREDFNMLVTLRRRWFSIPNSPITQTFAMDGSVADGKIGLGLQALNDRMSAFFTTGVYGSAAYHWDATVAWKVSVGLQGGINVLPVYDFGSNTFQNRALGSLGAGLWVHSDQVYLGISKPELFTQRYGSTQSQFDYRKPLYITAGLTLEPDESIKLIPSVLIVQEKNQKLRLDAGARGWYNEKVGVGVFYRMARINYVQLSGEVQVSGNIRVGYVYNSKAIETTIVSQNNNPISLHEILLKFTPNPSRFHIN